MFLDIFTFPCRPIMKFTFVAGTLSLSNLLSLIEEKENTPPISFASHTFMTIRKEKLNKIKKPLLVSLFSLSLKSVGGGLCLKINFPFFHHHLASLLEVKGTHGGRFLYLTHRPSSCILSKYNLTFMESPTRHTQLCFLLFHLFLWGVLQEWTQYSLSRMFCWLSFHTSLPWISFDFSMYHTPNGSRYVPSYQ